MRAQKDSTNALSNALVDGAKRVREVGASDALNEHPRCVLTVVIAVYRGAVGGLALVAGWCAV